MYKIGKEAPYLMVEEEQVEDFLFTQMPETIMVVNGVEMTKEELQAEYDSKQYQRDRATSYQPIGDQLDMIFHEIKANGSISADGAWATAIQEVKDLVPKPDDSTQPV